MAIPKIKATYSLDIETTKLLENTARRWGVSKSAALTRAIRLAAGHPQESAGGALSALDILQASLELGENAADRWADAVRQERTASSTAREPGGS